MDKILDDINFEDEQSIYVDATTGQRFANYFVDGIFLYIVYELFAYFFYGYEQPESIEAENVFGVLINLGINYIILVLYYTVSESSLKGKTVGKFVTKTRAVLEDNRPIDFSTAFVRNLIRIVPFEPFSFFGSSGRGWHDNWSKTKVIVDTDWEESNYV